MSGKDFLVSNYMRLSQVYVLETDTLLRSIEVMKKYKVDTILVINDDFSITGCITKTKIKEIFTFCFHKNVNLLRNFKVKDAMSKDKFPVIFYPKMELEGAFSIMKCIKSTYVAVVNEPWEKKIIGVLWLDDVLSIMKELPA